MNKKLTLDEAVSLLSGDEIWYTKSFENYGVRSLTLKDGPHGIRDGEPSFCYPNICLLACSWDKELLYLVGRSLGKEAKKRGVDVLLAPGVNIKRNPLGGRNFEYFSEDSLLAGKLAAEFVKGIQSSGTAACVKHFACNNRENGRYSYDVKVDGQTLREVYLKPFEIVVKEAKPKTIMTAYNMVNGAFASENETLLKILRDEFGFDGVIVSDWGGVNDRVEFYRVGSDLEMPGSDKKTHGDVISAIAGGRLSEEQIFKSADRVLSLVESCSSNGGVSAEADSLENFKINAEELVLAAAESMVLLENDGILPIPKTAKIAVVGNEALGSVFCGGGCANVVGENANSVLSALKGTFVNAEYVPDLSNLDKFDAVIVFLRDEENSEGFDRKDIKIDADLLKKCYKANKNTVAALINGSVADLREVKKYSSAIVETYYSGQVLGEALSMVLSGAVAPCGRLAETFINDVSDNFAFDEKTDDEIYYSERLSVGYKYYIKNKIKVAYPFGYGLSYGKFEYSDFALDKRTITENEDGLTASVTVKNVGDCDAKEVVQVYLSTDGKNGAPRVKLAGFEKIFLCRGEEKRAEIFIPKREFSRFCEKKGTYELVNGEFIVSVNKNAEEPIFPERVNSEPRFVADRYSTIGEIIKTERGAKIVCEKLRDAIIGCIIGKDDNYPFEIKNGRICGEKFFVSVAESLQLRQLVTMSNNVLSENELNEVIKLLNKETYGKDLLD